MIENVSGINFLLLLFYACVMGAAQIIFSNAARTINEAIPINGLLISTLSNSWLYFGLLIYGVATVFWLFILTRVDIRYAYPIASTAVIFSSLLQCYLTGSYPSFNYWIGLTAVIVGLALINNG